MSESEGFVEGVTQASPAALVGKDELGFSALTSQFVPPKSEKTSADLLKMTGFESDQQVEGSYVRLSPDEFVVVVHHALSDCVFVLWVNEGEEKSFFSKRADKQIEYRQKELTGFVGVGHGESGRDDGLALVSEFRDAVELVTMRELMGYARADLDVDPDGDVESVELTVTQEEEIDEMRSLMEEQG